MPQRAMSRYSAKNVNELSCVEARGQGYVRMEWDLMVSGVC